jgi:hypothetical protein
VLDCLAESRITEFQRKHRGRIQYPVSTEDLTILLEQHVSDLDLFYDFPSPSDEGVTLFESGKKPRVLISRRLTEDPRRENRLRSTIKHEFAHVILHSRLYNDGLLVQGQEDERAQRCAEAGMLAESNDWMEWQAGYYSGAALIPERALTRERIAFHNFDPLEGPLEIGSPGADEFTQRVARRFGTSVEFARVRLEKAGILYAPLSDQEMAAINARPTAHGLAHCANVLARRLGFA